MKIDRTMSMAISIQARGSRAQRSPAKISWACVNVQRTTIALTEPSTRRRSAPRPSNPSRLTTKCQGPSGSEASGVVPVINARKRQTTATIPSGAVKR